MSLCVGGWGGPLVFGWKGRCLCGLVDGGMLLWVGGWGDACVGGGMRGCLCGLVAGGVL